jgi:hypothetical protein
MLSSATPISKKHQRYNWMFTVFWKALTIWIFFWQNVRKRWLYIRSWIWLWKIEPEPFEVVAGFWNVQESSLWSVKKVQTFPGSPAMWDAFAFRTIVFQKIGEKLVCTARAMFFKRLGCEVVILVCLATPQHKIAPQCFYFRLIFANICITAQWLDLLAPKRAN